MVALLQLDPNSVKYTMDARELEKRVNAAFKLAVDYFEEQVGIGMTGEDTLRRAGREFFRKSFINVLASNEIPQRRYQKGIGYYIINNKPRGNTGEHWLGLIMTSDGSVIVWDSFGRDIKTLMPDLWGRYHKWIVIPDKDKEQKITQEDCGARCLAFLAIYDILGRNMAMLL